MVIAIICLSVICVGLMFSTYNLLRKYERLEDYSSTLEQWVNNINTQVNNTIGEMERINNTSHLKLKKQ